MATKKLDKTGLSQVWAKIIANFVAKESGKGLSTNDFTNEFKQQLQNLVATGGEVNVIESVSVNGVALDISNKGVNVLVPTGALASLDKVDSEHLADAVLSLINGKADKATTLAGYGITDAYKKTETYAKTETYSKSEVDSAISTAVNQAVAGVYVVKGSVAFASLPTSDMEVGHVYNITDAFTTTASFAEGAGKKYPAGTNVVYTENGWDAMAGTYDFSGYMLTADLVDITSEEIDTICVMS